ncbi:hypothetical protein Bpfe_023427 [Biomphalaria pfeifferi]|uniref:Uncharacterized protein n=1 Tax=Biomphalaria pfeifferi TaxID=112525 RepID=A0AAD8B321_BIOPF|nr:hypothetical protein Bpfe_023427 [Biomphalaria pfeifferi]
MIGGHEVSKVLQDLELSFEIKRSKESEQHHEQDKGFQENFKAAVCRLMDVIQETGNPFLEKSAELVTLHDNNIVDAAVHKTLNPAKCLPDVVWDCYRSDSLKAFTRERRGLEKRKRVTPETVLPSQWGSFLRVDANKTQLFAFLARYLLTVQSEKLIVTTQGPDVISNKPIDHTNLSPCNHEEPDTRMMLHLVHAAEHCRRILIRTVDTDVMVLSVAAMTRHPHLFTGCDTISCFNGIGKKTAWEVWSKCDHVTDTFQKLCCAPFELTANDMSVLERFVTLLYDRGSNCHDVNSARKYMFTKTGRLIENISPTSEALFQHCKRAIYQGGHIWSQAHERQPVLPDPSDWGFLDCFATSIFDLS